MVRPKSDIRERVLDAARDEFLARGVDGAALRAIARAADTSIGLIYYYFPTKDDLFLGVVEPVYARLLERLEGALTPTAFPVQVRAVLQVLAALTPGERAVARLLVREALTESERRERLLARARAEQLPRWLELMKRGVREGHIHASHEPLVAAACLAAFGAPLATLGPRPGGARSGGASRALELSVAELACLLLSGWAAPAGVDGGCDAG